MSMIPPTSDYRGPHPGIVATVFVLLFAISIVFYATGSTLWNSFFQLGAAIPLAIFTAAATTRLRSLGIQVAGVQIAYTGGVIASVMLLLSAACGLTLARSGIGVDGEAFHAVTSLGFLTGGAAHVAALGLLMAGVSVPGLLGRLMPRWLAWLGLILAGVAELSVFSVVLPQALPLLPIARFGCFFWMIATGFSLMKG